MKQHSLKKRYIVKLIANIINAALNFVIVAVVPKSLGPTYYGYFTYLDQFFQKAISFVDAGTSMAFFVKLSQDNKRIELIKFYLY